MQPRLPFTGERLFRLLRRFPISPRIWFLVALAVFGFLASGIMGSQMLERALLAERKQGVEQMVTAAHGVVAEFHRRSAEGELSESEARERALEALRSMRYAQDHDAGTGRLSGYLWVNDTDHRVLMHPTRPELEGQDLEDYTDPDGTPLVAEAVEIAKHGGGGFMRYLWPMPSDDTPVEKISHVRLFEPWGWVIASGVYLGPVRSALFDYIRMFSAELIALILILTLAGTVVTRSITRPLARIRHSLARFAHEPTQAVASLDSEGDDELARLSQTLKQLGNLPNRQFIVRHLAAQIDQAEAHGEGVAVLLFDIDRFSDINKLLGERGADEVLGRVERRIQSQLGDGVATGRLAADEFVATLAGTDAEATVQRAEAALRAIEAPMQVHGHELLVTARAGIARYPEDAQQADELLNAADQAMRRAKELGGGPELFAAEMHRQLLERLELTRALRIAIQNDDLELAWQGQVTLDDGRLRGVEALLRWRHADGTPVSPGVFVPVAEQSGLILPLGDWVIERVCREAATLQHHLPAGTAFALNLSPQQVRPGTGERILYTAQRHGLSPNRLEVEITETSVSSAADELIDLLHELGRHGVRVAIDDFGTGYSNIASIKDLPVDWIKLDRTFVRHLADDEGAREIAQAVVAMTHAMGLELLAEGIETEEQAGILRRMGCDAGQGFLYSRPRSMEDWLREASPDAD